MNSDGRGVYIIRDRDQDADGGWVAPEPAEDVIVEEVLAATDLERETVEPLTDYVDLETLTTLLSGEGEDDVTFVVEDYAVTVDSDGAVEVADQA